MKCLLFDDDAQFWFETVRLFGHAAYGGSDFGEVLAAASQVQSHNYDSWHDAYHGLADRLAAEAATAGPITARDLWLRASTYAFTAQFFLHGNPDDPRIDRSYDQSVEWFRRAAALFEPTITPVEIPYQGTVLDGYLYRAPGHGPRPAVVMHSGFDGSAEELHYFGAWAGVERGYHVLTFDGPGQPSALRRGRVFRPDWEQVVGPVLDFLHADPAVDRDRTALIGVSLGGLLAPRAAAFEPRLAAVVALDGIYDAATAAVMMLPWDRAELARRAADGDGELGRTLASARTADPRMRWALDHGRYAFGVDSDQAFLAAFLRYTLAGGVAERISCPTLVCEAAGDMFFAGAEQTEPQRLYEHLTCPKTLLRFTAEEGADAHCHTGAQRLALGRIYDWLDTTLAHRRDGTVPGVRA